MGPFDFARETTTGRQPHLTPDDTRRVLGHVDFYHDARVVRPVTGHIQ
jgi:hypothetical protein